MLPEVLGEIGMPRGPQGQKRPADVIGAAVMVAKLATGELSETPKAKSGRTRSGVAGARARTKKLSAEQRQKIAKRAAEARWR
jgi:hypothetical protein